MIGQTLSHYKILAEISRGGMGIVYRALDTKVDREVAIKVLPQELVSDPETTPSFRTGSQGRCGTSITLTSPPSSRSTKPTG